MLKSIWIHMYPVGTFQIIFWLTKYQLFYIKSVRICLVKYQSCFYKKYLRKKVVQVNCCLSEVVSYKLAFDHDYSMATFLKILVLGISHLPMTTLKRTISDSYKHLRMTKAFVVRWIATVLFLDVISFRCFASDWGLGSITILTVVVNLP